MGLHFICFLPLAFSLQYSILDPILSGQLTVVLAGPIYYKFIASFETCLQMFEMKLLCEKCMLDVNSNDGS